MRRTFFLCTFTILAAARIAAQTAAPAVPAPRAPRAAAAAKPLTLALQVTDPSGAPLADVMVTATGTVSREGTTAADGSVTFVSMRPGNYRLRFVREGSTTLERDLTMRLNEPLTIDVSLSPAPVAPKAPEPAPETTGKGLPPPGDPKTTPIPLFLEKNFIGGREPRKESSLGCAATGTANLFQLRDTWAAHAHDDADEWIYVVAGEGTLRIGNAEQRVQAGTFSSVPHTVSHALIPQGRNPLILISILSGPACKS